MFPSTLSRKTCQGKTRQGKLASVNAALFNELCNSFVCQAIDKLWKSINLCKADWLSVHSFIIL